MFATHCLEEIVNESPCLQMEWRGQDTAARALHFGPKLRECCVHRYRYHVSCKHEARIPHGRVRASHARGVAGRCFLAPPSSLRPAAQVRTCAIPQHFKQLCSSTSWARLTATEQDELEARMNAWVLHFVGL